MTEVGENGETAFFSSISLTDRETLKLLLLLLLISTIRETKNMAKYIDIFFRLSLHRMAFHFWRNMVHFTLCQVTRGQQIEDTDRKVRKFGRR